VPASGITRHHIFLFHGTILSGIKLALGSVARKKRNHSRVEVPMGERCIFVIDDDQAILDSFDAMLGDDYPIYYETNGINATKFIMERKPELLFLDIQIPGMNGIEVLKWIKNNNVESNVFLITALPQHIYKDIAVKFNVGFIKKPFDVLDIESITTSLFN
jgi:DNA-binding NtrC family response regulator